MHGTELEMAKTRGRPRKTGDRYPSGQLKSKHNRANASRRREASPTLWHRIRENFEAARDRAVELGLDETTVSAIGRLNLAGVLTDAQAATALYIGETIGRHERFIDAPKRSAASVSYMGGYNKAIDPYQRGDAQTIADYERAARRARKAYDRVLSMLPTERAATVIYEVCVHDQPIAEGAHDDLSNLLEIIGRKLGFVAGRADHIPVQPIDIGQAAKHAVDELERWFSDKSANVTEFVVLGSPMLRSISARASVKGRDMPLVHAVRVATVGNADLVDAALRSAANHKGWQERVTT